MSSPPNSITLPKKRPSLSVPNQAAKRRKPSTGPSSLRQTSFPPPEGYSAQSAGSPGSATTPRYAFSRSPSVESSIVGSAANGTEGGRKGRKRKRGGASAIDDGRSATGTLRGGQGQEAEGEAEDEDEGPGDVEVNLEGGGKPDEARQKQEREHLKWVCLRLLEERGSES